MSSLILGPDGLPTLDSICRIPAERIDLPKLLTDEETKSLEGEFLKDEQIRHVVRGNYDVYSADDGKPLLKMRVNVIPQDVCVAAYAALHEAGTVKSDNRGMAGGKITEKEIMDIVNREGGTGFRKLNDYRFVVIKADGTESKVTRAKRTMGTIVGYFGASSRHPYCRLTAYAQQHFDRFEAAHPMVRWVNQFYKALMPESYALQQEAVRKSSQDFVIAGTAFSTITVNKNFRTALHYDAGDFAEGFGNLAVIRRGTYEGCHTGFPQYGVAANMHSCDVLLMDVHQLHGNTPMVAKHPKSARLALVMYFRDDIRKCGSFEEEVAKAQTRRDA